MIHQSGTSLDTPGADLQKRAETHPPLFQGVKIDYGPIGPLAEHVTEPRVFKGRLAKKRPEADLSSFGVTALG